MKVIMNDDVKPNYIHQLREYLRKETKETKRFLGITVKSLTRDLPIKNRDFNLWIGYSKKSEIVGFITFTVDDESLAFIKSIYIVPEFRHKGYGKKLLEELLRSYSKLECKINEGNTSMYKIAKSVGLKGEKNRYFYL